MTARLAHTMQFVEAASGRTILLFAAGAIFVLLLLIENTYVKHGRLTPRLIMKPLAMVVVIGLAATLGPLPSAAQDRTTGTGLPDLISDPPFIWALRDFSGLQGRDRLLLFDGHIHNIGEGPLEVSGNPQIEGDVQQRVFDGSSWTAVATPMVQFETDDGHNHFHLANAMEYSLWDITQGEQLANASKVGFCLVDTEQVEEGSDGDYLIDDINYCSADDPDTEELTMGISPGWRDTYDATVTFQWVDVSAVQPGIYWIGAITDPLDQIAESNEDNNDLVFSSNSFAIDGYRALELGPQSASEPITLRAAMYGTAGQRAFVISRAPSNGTLDVPTGVDLVSIDQVRYTPNSGFTGTDSFEYYVHDLASPYPYEPRPTVVSVTADSAVQTDTAPPGQKPAIVDPGALALTQYEPFELALTETTGLSDVQWYGGDLPPGLSVDPSSGQVSGVPMYAGTYQSVIVARQGRAITTLPLQWTVESQPRPSLRPTNETFSTGGRLIQLLLGSGSADAIYEADGLPEGIIAVENLPNLTGVPREIGTFDIEVRELVDGEVVDQIEFTWTITPSTRPEFAL